jgi:hypothetical protein
VVLLHREQNTLPQRAQQMAFEFHRDRPTSTAAPRSPLTQKTADIGDSNMLRRFGW